MSGTHTDRISALEAEIRTLREENDKLCQQRHIESPTGQADRLSSECSCDDEVAAKPYKLGDLCELMHALRAVLTDWCEELFADQIIRNDEILRDLRYLGDSTTTSKNGPTFALGYLFKDVTRLMETLPEGVDWTELEKLNTERDNVLEQQPDGDSDDLRHQAYVLSARAAQYIFEQRPNFTGPANNGPLCHQIKRECVRLVCSLEWYFGIKLHTAVVRSLTPIVHMAFEISLATRQTVPKVGFLGRPLPNAPDLLLQPQGEQSPRDDAVSLFTLPGLIVVKNFGMTNDSLAVQPCPPTIRQLLPRDGAMNVQLPEEMLDLLSGLPPREDATEGMTLPHLTWCFL